MGETVPVQYAQSLLRLSHLPLAELEADLQELRLPLVLLKDKALPGARLSADDYGRLFIHLVKKLQLDLHPDPDDLDGALQFSAYRMVYLAMAHSRTLQQALQRAAVYFRRFEARGESFSLDTTGDRTECRFEFGDTSDPAGLIPPETFDMGQLNWLRGLTGRVLSLSMWHRLCGWFIGCNIDLESVNLAQPQPAELAPYTEMFGAPVNFGSDNYSFCFKSRYLDFPIVQGEEGVGRLLRSYPAELLKLESGQASLSSRIRRLLGQDLSAELPGLQDIAARLFMTAPTLHRRLQQEGTSYQQIKDACRRDAALEKLQTGAYTASQLAELLGFSDASTFHRAFRKWTGVTPAEYRQQQLTGGTDNPS